MRSLGDVWLAHPDRRTYSEMDFYTDGKVVPDGAYNLWQGFAVRPDPAVKWPQVEEHLREIACAGSEEHYQYLLRWHARAVQLPGVRAEISPVLVGPHGTGKTATGMILFNLLGHAHAR